MSDNMSTYIIETKDGFRVVYGSELENYYKNPLDERTFNYLSTVPFFYNKEHALEYAKIVDEANRTEYGVVILDRFKYENFNELRNHR